MKLISYTKSFAIQGIPKERIGMVGSKTRGPEWCALNSDGVMVLMAHKSYFRRFVNPPRRFYSDPGPSGSPSANGQKSIEKLSTYFEPGKTIILMEAEFAEAETKFLGSTGKVFLASMLEFDPETGRMHYEITDALPSMHP